MRIAAIHQPQYLPYLGYFHKIAHCDVFVHLDNVQFTKGGIHNRNKIKTSSGWNWLTVPVEQNFDQLIKDVQINKKVNWANKHWNTLQTNYGKAPYFKDYAQMFHEIYAADWQNLSDLDVELARRICDALEIRSEFVMGSKLACSGSSTDRLIEICKKIGADAYLSGPGGKLYMEIEKFKDNGIELLWQEFHPPVYKQQFPKVEFISNLSVIDVMLNCGAETLELIHQKL